MLNYWLHIRKAPVMGFVLSDGQVHQNLRKYSWEKCDWCQWVSTVATSHSPEKSSWSTCPSCLNTVRQKERLAASRRHLRSSETAKLPAQVGISCQPVPWKIRWCCRSKQSENKMAIFLPGNWAAGRFLQFSQREILKKLSSFYHLFLVPQFLVWYAYFSRELWYICVYVHPHMSVHLYAGIEVYSSTWTPGWSVDSTKDNVNSFIDSSAVWS